MATGLTGGTRLGPYEIVGSLGAGGMGEVYRARDTRLNRIVAIKVLPLDIGHDPFARARFEREARAIAALSHPNIRTLHDVGNQDGTEFLVMEHLDGETLAHRLTRGPLPVSDALRFGAEIADGLACAHQAGVVHRDVKPGNVMLVTDGAGHVQAKLLDFGIARAVPSPAGAFDADPAETSARTSTDYVTGPGAILGTFQYMSPEQLEGRLADARSDVFAFGAMLYEMLAGRRAFDGDSQARVISLILEGSSPLLPADRGASPALSRVVTKCLAKSPGARWQSAADLADELRWIARTQADLTLAPGRALATPRWRALIPWALVGLAVAVAVWAMVTGGPAPQEPTSPVRFTVSPPAGGRFSFWDLQFSLALSPDGRHLAYTASTGGAPQLWVRTLDATDARLIPNSDGAGAPFWSPDSRQIAFMALGKLKKAAIDGTPPVEIRDVYLEPFRREGRRVRVSTKGGWGPRWRRDGRELFYAGLDDQLYAVPVAWNGTSAQVGAPTPLFRPTGLRDFDVSPDGTRFLINRVTSEDSQAPAVVVLNWTAARQE